MKIYLGVGIVLLALSPLSFGQSIVTDPLVPGVSQCGVLLDTAPEIKIPVTPQPSPAIGNICSFKVNTVSPGTHTIKMTSITTNDPVWGSQESAPSLPLTFTRPAAPSVPSGLQLVP